MLYPNSCVSAHIPPNMFPMQVMEERSIVLVLSKIVFELFYIDNAFGGDLIMTGMNNEESL